LSATILGLGFVDQSPGSLVGLLHPPDQPMSRTGRRKPLRPGGCRSSQLEGGVGKRGDGKPAVAGRGENLRDPALDFSRDHDARRFAGLQYGDDLIGLGAFEVRFDELVAAALRRLQDRNAALLRPLLQPLLKAIATCSGSPGTSVGRRRKTQSPSPVAETAGSIR
jgi:hypothetical protein